MKQRTGFISNSSSSSFLIPKYYLSQEQIDLIKDYRNSGKDNADTDGYDDWNIEEVGIYLKCSTNMDNFDMYEYMEEIGVPMNRVKQPSRY